MRMKSLNIENTDLFCVCSEKNKKCNKDRNMENDHHFLIK